MSLSESTVMATETTSGLFAEAIGGVATIVLSILALSGIQANFLLSVATIVFAAALLIEGTSIVAQYARTISASPAMQTPVNAGTLSAVFIAGVTGIILGVLALLGIHALVLDSVATIVFGSALILNAGSTANLHMSAASSRSGGEIVFGSSSAQVLAGVAAVVLGILSVAGEASLDLALIALLVLGAAILMTGNGMNNAVVTMFRNGGPVRRGSV